MTRLSVNVNKIATLRNARGGNNPNLIQVVKDCEKFGAQGITVHPRTDERHITLLDVYEISKIVSTDYNIEGYPDKRFVKIIEERQNLKIGSINEAAFLCGFIDKKQFDKNYFYFVHSYYVSPSDNKDIFGISYHQDFKFTSIIKKRNIIGTQFHPEKSGKTGISFLKNLKNSLN